jgi:hypothetical protein
LPGWADAVAAEHYLTLTEDHFALAQARTNSGAQKAAQHGRAPTRTDSQNSSEAFEEWEDTREDATSRKQVQTSSLPPRGLEPLS